MTDPENDRVADRRIELSLPIIEGSETVPDQTAGILARLRAEGVIDGPVGSLRRSPWRLRVAAAVILLGAGTAIALAVQRQGPRADTVAGADTAQLGRRPSQADRFPGPGAQGTQVPAALAAAQDPPTPQDPGRTTLSPKEPATPAKSNSWFATTELDLGTRYPTESAVGTFRFRNPSAEARRFTSFRQSCSCTKATFTVGGRGYVLESVADDAGVLVRGVDGNGLEARELVDSIAIGPGEEGVVEVHMEMRGTRGTRHASIGFSIDDPELPSVTLSFHALGTVYFNVSPEEVNLGTMLWDETRGFQVEVTSPVADDFTITGFDPLPEGVNVRYEKSSHNGRTLYTIRGTYAPNGNGSTLVFHTDQEGRSFTVRIIATVEEPVTLDPPFAAFGMIRKESGASRTVTIRPSRPFDLRVVDLGAQDLSFDPQLLSLSWTPIDAGGVEIGLQVLPGAPAGTLVGGNVIVHLNHPAAVSRTIHFNGFVR